MGTDLEFIPLSSKNDRLVSKAYDLSQGSTICAIYWISVFNFWRLYKLSPVEDTTTITSGFKGRLSGLLKIKYLSSLLRVIQSFRQEIDQNWSVTWKWHISGSSGPNGPLSYTRYLDDLRALHREWLGVYIVLYILFYPYVNKWETLKALKDAYLDSLEKGDKQAIHSRFAFLSDKGGKTRVVAIVDILSQSCLKAVHQRCNLILRRLTQDGTFDQDKTRDYIKKKSELNEFLASIDLTAATDRMPALFQMLVIISLGIVNPIQGLLWWLVTTRRDFRVSKGSSKTIRYAVGQPMGALSSWPVMAISHHFLVRLAYAASGFPRKLRKAPYALLGDDLTIVNEAAAKTYLDLISCLGMDYSPDKTYLLVGNAEFAKSLFRKGEDLTPFPVSNLVFRQNTVVSNVQVIMSECKRRKISLTAATLVGLFPKKWRNLVLLAALSPSSPIGVLDLPSRTDNWIFFQFHLARKIKYFSRLSTVRDSTHAFAFKDPGKSGKWLASPFLQIARDNGDRYPVRRLKDLKSLRNPELLIGLGWISYDPVCWPDGIPPFGDRKWIPGPTWQDATDDRLYRSSLVELDKLLPGYFTVRCTGPLVGT